MQQATYMTDRDVTRDRFIRGTARLGTGSKVHAASMIYQTDVEGVERSFGFVVLCRQNRGYNQHGFEPANEDGREVDCRACYPQKRNTEDWYKQIGNRLVTFSTCKTHTDTLGRMLGAMAGSSIDINDGNWTGAGTHPCIVCESKAHQDDGLIGLIGKRVLLGKVNEGATNDF